MSPTLKGDSFHNGDWILTEKLNYWLRAPRRWEVVTFRNKEGSQIMKRVIGLPGETVAIRDRRLQVDGETLIRPPTVPIVKYYAYGNLFRGKPAACGDGYYVLGDDSKDSQDSRFEGPLDPDHITGRAWLIVWPPERMGWVKM